MIFKFFAFILNKLIKNPHLGLPNPIFYFVTRITPMVNVDLLVISKKYGFFLTCREDEYAGKGWHLPGGIIRVNETFLERANQVALNELNISIKKIVGPFDINQVIFKNMYYRSHFISFLFKCYLSSSEELKLLELAKSDKNSRFFKKIPKNFLHAHYIYKNYFK